MRRRQLIGWRRMVATHLLIVLCAVLLVIVYSDDTVFAPNHFLGTCLDDAWVARVEAKLGVSAQQRDALGRLVHPFLHAALRETRFHVNDPRTANARAFTELPEGAALYGAGAKVDAVDGTVLDAGVFNRSLVVELNGWTTHSLATLVFSILAREVYGYGVAHLLVTDTLTITQRMSSVLSGALTPTHVNLEVWIAGIQSNLQVYANESFAAGGLGYFGRSGLYTSVDFVRDSLPLFANFWKSYEIHEQLIGAVPVSSLKSSKFFPPKEVACADNNFGCLNHCAKTHACTLREQATPAKECMVVAMMYDYYDPGYLQAVLANLNLAAYMCFLGYDGLEEFVVDAQKRRQPVLFYHFEPDLFHFHHSGLFDRVFLPRSTPERVALATGTFGERGYGKPTDNPVDVDFPSTKLSKYASSHIRGDAALVQLITQFSLSELDINDLLRKYLQATSTTTTNEPDPTFRAACEWVKENYATWSLWLERLPECTLETHVLYDITGCVDDADEEIDPGMRTISFRWRMPHPENTTKPYDCDGGLTELPHAIFTSRSCEWLKRDQSRWASWIDEKPECDRQFFKYTISPCNANAKRMIRYAWHLPDPANPTQSLECAKGAALPRSIEEECDYMPYASPVFVSIATADGILVALIVLATVFVFVERNAAIIKRSQYELLLLILAGGLLVCVAILLYAGPPTPFLCGARPLFMSAGFTTIFGALLVKSLRVYRVFMRAGFKKNTVKLASVVRVFVAIFAVDLLIIAAWYAMDFPAPTTKLRRSVKFDGYVTDLVCASSSFLFTAMMFFWKAIVLFVGLYISFLIRNVSSDFQESLWTFAACLIVLVGCVIVLPIAYIVDLAAAPFFVFLASVLLICTTLVMAVMMIPKIWRLRASPTIGVVRTSLSENGSHRHGPRSVRSAGRAGADMSQLTDGTSNHDERREPGETTQMEMTPVIPMAGGSPGKKPVSRN